MRALVGVVLAMLAGAPAAAETFDDLAAKAKLVAAEDFIWTISESCKGGDAVEQRQCRILRDKLEASWTSTSLMLVEARPDDEVFDIDYRDTDDNWRDMLVSNCLWCRRPVKIAGKPWVLVGKKAKLRVGKGAIFSDTHYSARKTLADKQAIRAWLEAVRHVRVHFIVKVPPVRVRDGLSSGFRAIDVEIVGFRVVTPCDGKIVVSFPAAAPLPPDKQACPKPTP